MENKIFTVHDKAGNGGTCKSNAPVDQSKPTCSLKLDGTSIVATYEDDKGISYFGWNSSYSGEQIDYKAKWPDGRTEILMYSDWEKYGGSTKENNAFYSVEGNTIKCTMAPYSAALFKID